MTRAQYHNTPARAREHSQCLTAWYGLVDLGGIRIRRKNKKRPVVLVHSCAGGVGLFAAELVQRLGGTACPVSVPPPFLLWCGLAGRV
jgi:hypothetical protein